MAGPIGIPDFTALVGDPRRLAARLDLDVQPIINQLDAAIVSHTYASVPRSPNALAKELGWSVETVSRRIAGLTHIGALIETGTNRYVRPAELSPVGRLYAIEAKMSDRMGAVRQGRTYGAWADSYVLVMGHIGQRRLEMLTSDVELDRAGLMVDSRWVRRPALNSLSKVRRLWSSEHFVAAVRPSDYQPSVAP
jgi:biotin operon repressor